MSNPNAKKSDKPSKKETSNEGGVEKSKADLRRERKAIQVIMFIK